MRRLMLLALFALALMPAAGVAAAPVSPAKERISASGTFDLIFGTLTTEQVGPRGPCRVNLTGTYVFHGTIEAEGPATLMIIVHHPCDDSPPFTYRENGRISGTLTGTVAGVPGSFDFDWVFNVRDHVALGALVIKHGSGGLAGLHGVLRTQADQTPEPATYTGVVSLTR